MLADPLFIVIDTSVKDRDYAKQGPICTGPYVVKEYSKAKAVMEANPNYWDGEVPFKHVEIPTIDDPNTRAMALQSGEIDMAINIAAGDLSLFNKKDKFNISEIASLRTVLAQINMNEGRPLHDIRVREALISCLDRETYNKVLLKDTFIPGKAPVPPSLDYGFDQLKDPNTYNVERAKKLLADAGWKDTDGDGIVDKDGKPLAIDFVYYSGRAELPLYAEATQADAKKIGIMYTTSEVNSASTLAEYKEKAADYGFEIVESGVSSTADIPLAADSLLEQVDCLNNLTDNTVVASLPLILSKANAKNIPVFGSEIEQVKIGCLAAMGLDYVDLGKQTGRMAAEVLKGEKKASELNFEVIEEAAFYGNSKVAEDLGITFPEDLSKNAKELFTEITQ